MRKYVLVHSDAYPCLLEPRPSFLEHPRGRGIQEGRPLGFFRELQDARAGRLWLRHLRSMSDEQSGVCGEMPEIVSVKRAHCWKFSEALRVRSITHSLCPSPPSTQFQENILRKYYHS